MYKNCFGGGEGKEEEIKKVNYVALKFFLGRKRKSGKFYSPLHGFIWNQHSDQLPVGLLAQLVERCTGIAEVMGSNPVQA